MAAQTKAVMSYIVLLSGKKVLSDICSFAESSLDQQSISQMFFSVAEWVNEHAVAVLCRACMLSKHAIV